MLWRGEFFIHIMHRYEINQKAYLTLNEYFAFWWNWNVIFVWLSKSMQIECIIVNLFLFLLLCHFECNKLKLFYFQMISIDHVYNTLRGDTLYCIPLWVWFSFDVWNKLCGSCSLSYCEQKVKIEFKENVFHLGANRKFIIPYFIERNIFLSSIYIIILSSKFQQPAPEIDKVMLCI